MLLYERTKISKDARDSFAKVLEYAFWSDNASNTKEVMVHSEIIINALDIIEDSISKDTLRKILEEKVKITNTTEPMTLDIYIRAKHEIDLLKQLLEEE